MRESIDGEAETEGGKNQFVISSIALGLLV